jgi:hypothetical protein
MEQEVFQKAKGARGVYWLVSEERKLCKFGSSYDIYKRVKGHKSKDFKDFVFYNIIETSNYIQLENKIRDYANATYLTHKEIISFNDMDEIDTIFQSILDEKELLSYSESNLYELKKLELENNILDNKNKILENENKRMELELRKVQEDNEKMKITGQIIEKNKPITLTISGFLDKLYPKKGVYMKMDTLYDSYIHWMNLDTTNYVDKVYTKRELKALVEEHLEKHAMFEYKKYKKYRVKDKTYNCFRYIELI